MSPSLIEVNLSLAKFGRDHAASGLHHLVIRLLPGYVGLRQPSRGAAKVGFLLPVRSGGHQLGFVSWRTG
jgi:hypothetical protein